jgi:hypothetical protein
MTSELVWMVISYLGLAVQACPGLRLAAYALESATALNTLG